MRRTVLVALLVVTAAASAAATLTPDGDERYRVAAVFDTAKGMVPGQLLKIAGVKAGKVTDVSLLPGPRALMTFEVDKRFAPFRADASCTILPEGLISENFVQCDPGTSTQALPGNPDGIPRVPVAQTTVPVSLQDFIDTFSLPTDERIREVINGLGIGTAGRGADINGILRRANPALADARRVLGQLDDQNRELVDAVAQTDEVLGRVAERDGAVRRFVRASSRLARTTAAHRHNLERAVRQLPKTLVALDPAMTSLQRAFARGTPVLRRLRASAPTLNQLARAVPSFTRPGRRGVRALAAATRSGRSAVRVARPAGRALAGAAAEAGPTLELGAAFLKSFQRRGGGEGLLRLLYGLATVSAGYDRVSHFLPIYVTVHMQCLAAPSARGCSHAYHAPGMGRIPVNDPTLPPRGNLGSDGSPPTTRRSTVTRRQIAALMEYLLGA